MRWEEATNGAASACGIQGEGIFPGTPGTSEIKRKGNPSLYCNVVVLVSGANEREQYSWIPSSSSTSSTLPPPLLQKKFVSLVNVDRTSAEEKCDGGIWSCRWVLLPQERRLLVVFGSRWCLCRRFGLDYWTRAGRWNRPGEWCRKRRQESKSKSAKKRETKKRSRRSRRWCIVSTSGLEEVTAVVVYIGKDRKREGARKKLPCCCWPAWLG